MEGDQSTGVLTFSDMLPRKTQSPQKNKGLASVLVSTGSLLPRTGSQGTSSVHRRLSYCLRTGHLELFFFF